MISYSFNLSQQGEKSTAWLIYYIKLPKPIEESYLHFKHFGSH